MLGGDFPAWLAVLLGRALTTALTDTRGECIYSACPHYNKCFIEATIRRARRAEIVVANHALVMIQAAFGGDEAYLPSRYVFDEGHHLFGTADSVFSAHLSGMETADLRRWLVGAEKGSRTRSPGLKKRIEDQLAGDAQTALHEVLQAALALPAAGWRQRLAEDGPRGPAEIFLARVRQQVYARKQGGESSYSLETSPRPAVPGLLAAAAALAAALIRMDKPLAALIKALDGLLDDKADELDSATRSRIEATSRGLGRRGLQQLRAWCAMLEDLEGPTPDEFIDWFGVERVDGRDIDVGFYRHWIDPTRPFAEIVAQPAHGLLMTSATLCDNSGDKDSDWGVALMRTGARHLASSPVKALVPSPFDYAGLTRIMVVTDVKRDDIHQVAAAYRELFLAAGGGALGLFTAIARLRRVNGSIAGPLEAAGLSLLVQHVDGLDTGTLIDIFRAEEDACLLGTDAVRDGIDMPGRSLRLIVFDRVPWPRPDIVHRSRRQAFGGREYDDMLTRLRLKQAYGRLVRRADDRGVFVLLDRGLPSRLAGAFPEGVAVRRLGLAEAVVETREFLAAGG
jgi:ATP-dependent DNA helicase DinG